MPTQKNSYFQNRGKKATTTKLDNNRRSSIIFRWTAKGLVLIINQKRKKHKYNSTRCFKKRKMYSIDITDFKFMGPNGVPEK